MHLRYAQPRIPVYLSRAKDIKDAFKVCPTPDPCLLVERAKDISGFPCRTENQIINSSYHENSPDPVHTLAAMGLLWALEKGYYAAHV
jgi:hypothetical protein